MNENLRVAEKTPYPPREGYRSAGFGYASDMVHIAVNRDDADAFMKFLKEIGGVDCEAIVAGNVANYAADHGAENCLRAMFDGREKIGGNDLAFWLKRAENPSYGPKARKLI